MIILRQKLFTESKPKKHLTLAQKLRKKLIKTTDSLSVNDEQLNSKLREKAKGYDIPILGNLKGGQSSYQRAKYPYMTDEFVDHIIDNNLIKSEKDAKWVQKNGKKIVESIEKGNSINLPGGGVIDPKKRP